MGFAFNPETKQFFDAVDTGTPDQFPGFVLAGGEVNPQLISDIKNLLSNGVSPQHWKYDGSNIVELSAKEKDDALVDPAAVAAVKDQKFVAVDGSIEGKLSSGFQYNGTTFALDLQTQILLLSMLVLKDHPAFVYPVPFNSIDDTQVVNLKNAAQVEEFVLAAVGRVRTVFQTATGVKEQIRQASSVTDVIAIPAEVPVADIEVDIDPLPVIEPPIKDTP
jgi:hypothetical protein